MSNCGCAGGAGSQICTCFTASSCQDINDFYADLPGTSGNFFSTPDSPAVSVTGDIDIRVEVAADDWTPATNVYALAKIPTHSNFTNASYGLIVTTAGRLRFDWTADGINGLSRTSSVSPTISDGETLWVRTTLDVDNGAGGHDVTFYTSDDGVTWTQLGATVTTAGTTSIFDSATAVTIGATSAGARNLAGNFYYAEIRNGIDGPVVARFDADEANPTVGTQDPGSFISSTGETWMGNGAEWVWGADTEEVCVIAEGNGTNFAPFTFRPSQIPNPRPQGIISRSTPQTLSVGNVTEIEFDQDDTIGLGGMVDFATTPFRLKASVAGIYLVGAFFMLDQSTVTNTTAGIFLHKNNTVGGTPLGTDRVEIAPALGFNVGLSIMTLVDLDVGDTVRTDAFSGIGRDIINSDDDLFGAPNCRAYMWAQWVSDL